MLKGSIRTYYGKVSLSLSNIFASSFRFWINDEKWSECNHFFLYFLNGIVVILTNASDAELNTAAKHNCLIAMSYNVKGNWVCKYYLHCGQGIRAHSPGTTRLLSYRLTPPAPIRTFRALMRIVRVIGPISISCESYFVFGMHNSLCSVFLFVFFIESLE